MDSLKQNRALMVGLIVAVVAGIAYWAYQSQSSGEEDEAFGVRQLQFNPEALEVLAALKMIESLKVDVAFFESPAFTSLQDFTTPIAPVEPGRRNPFEFLNAGDEFSEESPGSSGSGR